MVFKNLCILVLLTKVVLALEGLKQACSKSNVNSVLVVSLKGIRKSVFPNLPVIILADVRRDGAYPDLPTRVYDISQDCVVSVCISHCICCNLYTDYARPEGYAPR